MIRFSFPGEDSGNYLFSMGYGNPQHNVIKGIVSKSEKLMTCVCNVDKTSKKSKN